MRISNHAVVVAGLLFASRAYAADHLMHVNEVMLNGGNGEQYIEFHDTATEPLTQGAPYDVKIYDGAGTMVDTIALTGITAGPTVFFTIGNAAAATTYSSVTFDGTITNDLPTTGQACFERANDFKIHCVAWGCPAAPIAGAQTAMAPASGMSLSRLSSSALHHSTATPKAANSAGTLATCPSNPIPDAGVTPDADSPPHGDAGTGGGGGLDDDEGGCCQSSRGGGAGAAFLSLLVLGSVLRRRRRV